MKYFKKELWYQFGSSDQLERENAFLIWEQNVEAYKAYLRTIMGKVQRKTMDAINEIAEGKVSLHDFRFAGIVFTSTECSNEASRSPFSYKRNCHLQLTDGETKVELIMYDVKKINIDVRYDTDYFDVRWGYCEFSYQKPNVALSVLCDSGNVWEFEFSTLTIVKTVKTGEKTGDGSVS